MERINANEVQSMMEAYASIYDDKEQEVISEETQELQENQANRDKQRELRQKQMSGRAQQQFGAKPRTGSFRDRIRDRRSQSATAQANTNKAGQTFTPAQVAALKKPAASGGDKKPPLTAKDRAYGPNSTLNKDQQAVNREYDRLRAKDPEAAAVYGKKMAALGAAKKDFSLPKPTQAQSNPTAAQKQARVDAAIARVNRPENLNKPAPVGSALRAQQDKQAAAKAAPVVKKPVRMGARNRMRMEEIDVFDTIKEYLIGEGATEEEALKQMLALTDEQRTEIIEGSCGSKKKKKGGYGK